MLPDKTVGRLEELDYVVRNNKDVFTMRLGKTVRISDLGKLLSKLIIDNDKSEGGGGSGGGLKEKPNNTGTHSK